MQYSRTDLAICSMLQYEGGILNKLDWNVAGPLVPAYQVKGGEGNGELHRENNQNLKMAINYQATHLQKNTGKVQVSRNSHI